MEECEATTETWGI